MPDKPDSCIGLFVWAHNLPTVSDGTGTRYIQVQVRDADPDAAYVRVCTMLPLLDSGPDEDLLQLTPDRWCIGRPRAGVKKLSVDAMGRRWDSDTKTLRKEIMQEEAERKESVRRLHVRIDEHIEKYHVEEK